MERSGISARSRRRRRRWSVRKLEEKHPRLHFCYEAGPTGYGLYRQTVETRPPLRYRCALADPETSRRARQD